MAHKDSKTKEDSFDTITPMKMYKDAADVYEEHQRTGCRTVIYRNQVYDVSDYLDKIRHPGGNCLIEEYFGKDLTVRMHERDHSKSAYKTLQKYKIGEIETKVTYSIDEKKVEENAPVKKKTFFIDDKMAAILDQKINLRKPLFPQIISNKLTLDEYMAFIMEPKILEEPGLRVRVFESDRFEKMTHGNWYAMIVKYLPIILSLFIYHFFFVANYSTIKAVGLILLGIFDWTLTEYLMHRFIFHFPRSFFKKDWVFGLHFLIHGIHHSFPLEPGRLGFPIILIGPILSIKLTQFFSLFCYNSAVFTLIGFFIGYVGYDLLHYYVHHSTWTFFPGLRQYHMNHHFKNPDLAYGVTTRLWDRVFGTFLAD